MTKNITLQCINTLLIICSVKKTPKFILIEFSTFKHYFFSGGLHINHINQTSKRLFL